MISKQMEQQLNEQINKELFSAYLYMAMSAYCSTNYLDGFANFFKVQAQEEVGHALKMYGYVNEQGARVVLEALDKPQADYKDVEEVYELAYKHEQKITASINALADLAVKEKDHATGTFLNWFITEQVEEEANMDTILHKIKMLGKTGQALLIMDAQVGKRE